MGGHDVVVVRPGEFGIGGDVEPELVHEFNVLRAQTRRVRADQILANRAVGSADFQAQARAGLGHALPGVAGQFGLLVSRELVREATDHACGIEALRGDHDGIEDVGGRDYQQMNWLALFFRRRRRRR